jgi:hypothetical protein
VAQLAAAQAVIYALVLPVLAAGEVQPELVAVVLVALQLLGVLAFDYEVCEVVPYFYSFAIFFNKLNYIQFFAFFIN